MVNFHKSELGTSAECIVTYPYQGRVAETLERTGAACHYALQKWPSLTRGPALVVAALGGTLLDDAIRLLTLIVARQGLHDPAIAPALAVGASNAQFHHLVFKSRSVQRVWPSGGVEQAIAISRASFSPGFFPY